MNVRSTAGLGLTLGLCLGLASAHAGDGWVPASVPAQPVATLGRPVASSSPVVPTTPALRTPGALAPEAAPVVRVSSSSAEPIYRAQAPDAVPPPGPAAAVPPPPVGAIPGGNLYDSGAVTPAAPSGNFFTKGFDQVKGSFHRNCGELFRSDHAGEFDHFASPVTSPFLTEDPRALTEVKPLFLYQNIPGGNPTLHGGSLEYFGVQARLALTERWSIVMNKLGGIFIQPDTQNIIKDQSGFSELWIGPKYTFYRDETNLAAAAVGLTFQFPVGDAKVFQNTGDLTLSPYFSFAKSFGKLPNQYGKFNYMSSTGFAFSTESHRSDYFYSNFHLDFDVLGQHRIYPLIELNWIRYINKGDAVPVMFEGADVVNFGASQLTKKNYGTIAIGARYKLGGCDRIQFGGAFEFPLSNQKDLNDFRVTLDVIFRY